jgi:hypothetical protein
MPKYWAGSSPIACGFCGVKLRTDFVDGATPKGWTLLCLECHSRYGYGLGTGKGQHYIKCQCEPNVGRWMKFVQREPITRPKREPKPPTIIYESREIKFP